MAQDKIAFVLWADRFDETLAALFVAELRQPSSGAYGLTLVPDLTLEQALPMAHQASCVVIPCGDAGLKRLKNDPRLQAFLAMTCSAGATLVVNQSGVPELERSGCMRSELVINEGGQELDSLNALRQRIFTSAARPAPSAASILIEESGIPRCHSHVAVQNPQSASRSACTTIRASQNETP